MELNYLKSLGAIVNVDSILEIKCIDNDVINDEYSLSIRYVNGYISELLYSVKKRRDKVFTKLIKELEELKESNKQNQNQKIFYGSTSTYDVVLGIQR